MKSILLYLHISLPIFFSSLSFAQIAAPETRESFLSVRNYSNQNVLVAKAIMLTKLNQKQASLSGCTNNCLVVTGWRTIGPNNQYKFAEKAGPGFCLRILRSTGEELVPEEFDNFLEFPISNERFAVCKTSHEQVLQLLSGKGSFVPGNEKQPWYKKSTNINVGGTLPDGWSRERFFVVTPEGPSQTFDILPKE